MRRRLDRELVRRGLARTTREARRAIEAGRVLVGGSAAGKPATMVAPDEAVSVARPERRYASRGGEKLAAALDRFGVDPSGLRCLDAGAAAGGFTDVLLTRSAAHVVAVDVGYGQLDWRLRTDERVTVMERTNIREITGDDLPYVPQLVTADLSFISLTKVVPVLVDVAADGAELLLLVKPQFEADRQEVDDGGLVADTAVWRRSVERVAEACRASGAGPLGVMPSPLRGPAGNVEFLVHARRGHQGRDVGLTRALSEVS